MSWVSRAMLHRLSVMARSSCAASSISSASARKSIRSRISDLNRFSQFVVGSDGHRDILGIVEGGKEEKEGWISFLRSLKKRGLKGIQLVVSDKSNALALSHRSESVSHELAGRDVRCTFTETFSQLCHVER
ncbi:MAG: transposase [Phycisphaerales bacterium]|nr:MAG: transposase [Phycisphaerales bacterium]